MSRSLSTVPRISELNSRLSYRPFKYFTIFTIWAYLYYNNFTIWDCFRFIDWLIYSLTYTLTDSLTYYLTCYVVTTEVYRHKQNLVFHTQVKIVTYILFINIECPGFFDSRVIIARKAKHCKWASNQWSIQIRVSMAKNNHSLVLAM